MRKTRTWMVGAVGVCWALGAAGCESGSAARNVVVEYRFENVRQTKGLDEWARIRKVLNDRAVRPVAGEITRSVTDGPVTLNSYKAAVVLPDLRSLDLVQEDLEELAAEPAGAGGSSRVQYSLVSMGATYKSNVVAATAQVLLSGVAGPGSVIRLSQNPGMVLVETKASGTGLWSARLSVVPDTRWVYGMSVDPSPSIPKRYFRIDVSTQKQEDLTEEEFREMAPKVAAPGAAEKAKDKEAEEFKKRREADDAAAKKNREAEDGKKGGK